MFGPKQTAQLNNYDFRLKESSKVLRIITPAPLHHRSSGRQPKPGKTPIFGPPAAFRFNSKSKSHKLLYLGCFANAEHVSAGFIVGSCWFSGCLARSQSFYQILTIFILCSFNIPVIFALFLNFVNVNKKGYHNQSSFRGCPEWPCFFRRAIKALTKKCHRFVIIRGQIF